MFVLVPISEMPFCTQCGNQVQQTDLFCARCGARQSAQAPPPGRPDVLGGVSSRTASMLCYIPFLGWLASIVVLASPRFHDQRDVRFHAFQGLYLFVVWLIVEMVVGPFGRHFPGPNPMRLMAGLLHIGVLMAWIWMIIKTAQQEMYRLPLLGELADRSLAEQR